MCSSEGTTGTGTGTGTGPGPGTGTGTGPSTRHWGLRLASSGARAGSPQDQLAHVHKRRAREPRRIRAEAVW